MAAGNQIVVNNGSDTKVSCCSCGGVFSDCDGPVHRYMTSSAGCWQAYGLVLEKEYSNPSYWQNHRLTVDAYAAQHPGDKSRQAIQSVGIHLISLYLVLEKGVSQACATRMLTQATEIKFSWLSPPLNMGDFNVGHVATTSKADSHAASVRSWANSVWQCWQEHHVTVKQWVDTSGIAARSPSL